MGFVSYLSKHPQSPAIEVSKDDKIFVVNRIKEFNFLLEDEIRRYKLSSNKTAARIKTSHSDDVTNHAQTAGTKQKSLCNN